MDVLVVGAGPAGTALAGACARRGLRTALLAPAPDRPWRATYAAWRHELPPLPAEAIAARASRAYAIAAGPHLLPEYVVFDNDALRVHLARSEVAVHRGRAVAVTHSPTDSTVHLADGRHLVAAVVVDATGRSRVLTGGPPRFTVAEQTAVGVKVPHDVAAPLLGSADALFMDWRPAPDQTGGWPTFLYALPLSGGRVLLEETSLARRPGLPLVVLRRRLLSRLDAIGVPVAELPEDEERVRFPLDLPLPGAGRVVPFGVAAGLVHPATGYSVATSLALAPAVARAIAEALLSGPVDAATAARRTLWSPAALGVHLLRRRGLAAVLSLPRDGVREFFELFFSLPARHRDAFLTGREDLTGTAAAMTALFSAASWPLRLHLGLTTLGLRRAGA
ncbi:putative carotenoid cyclase [Longimycelium tulufanense]|uniref:Putative carotenoid cyclase n=1 Tax=Longimycelium tulufanense TaxID=907463 RepID=A0A8J3CG67_9PSEU|nr:lycopene cyclase family protein [Longimycelium tulufanense]GGM62705.1 putative carotenoid cyclase [Longimycelium tulufanense]